MEVKQLLLLVLQNRSHTEWMKTSRKLRGLVEQEVLHEVLQYRAEALTESQKYITRLFALNTPIEGSYKEVVQLE